MHGRLFKLFVIGLMVGGALVTANSSRAQIIQLPDCNVRPEHPFCAPPAPARDPIVLIPGITVSQNKKLLYADQPGGRWKFALFFNVYRGLIKKLESAGYEQGVDLFVAHYDWRAPAQDSAEDYLKPMIDQAKAATGASKVDVVAHSFGGVVSRAYVQGDGYANDIDQLITLGSPHAGAADAYVAWEGGLFPTGWLVPIRLRVSNVERSLKQARNQPDIRRPKSIRSFFPSLHDMLPIDSFVESVDTGSVGIEELVEQNTFLRGLREGLDDMAGRGVRLATMAGADVPTLATVRVRDDRTREDEILERWRDGRAEPEVPPLNSTAGDARVLLENALLGEDTITLPGAAHHKLPDAAQDEVFAALGLEPQPSFFSNFPEKILSILILSPLEVEVVGPDGKVLSATRNDFGDEMAEYDDDPSDPDDPKVIEIGDPVDGEYRLTYTGTGEGEFTVVTTYADEDEVVSTTWSGETQAGQVVEKMVEIGGGTSSLQDDEDYVGLLEQIEALAKGAKKEKLLSGRQWSDVRSSARGARSDLRIYERRMRQDREEAALPRLRGYYEELEEIEDVVRSWRRQDELGALAAEILGLLEKIRRAAPVIS